MIRFRDISRTLSATSGRTELARLVSALFVWMVLAGGFTLLSGMLDGSGRVSPASDSFSVGFALTNALPGLLLIGLAWAATGRVVLSTLIAIALYATVLGINRLKQAHLGSPLMPQDIEFLTRAPASSISLFANYVPWPRVVAWGGAAFVVVVLGLRWTQRKFSPSPAARARAFAGIISLASLLALLVPSPFSGYLYGKERSAGASFDAMTNDAKFPGVINNLFAPQPVDTSYFRAGSPQQAASAIRHALGSTPPSECVVPATTASVPDIVVVQSEAFFDIAKMQGMGVKEATPNFRRLSKQGLHGDLFVPTLGGNTIRTEYEVLTGQPLWVDPGITYPYFEVGAFTMPGLISALNRNGYETISIHANSGAFWRRSDTFRELGFDRQVWAADFRNADRTDFYIPDKYMTDEILRALEMPRASPRFVYAIGIENHGPYEYHPGDYHRKHDTKPESDYALPATLPGGERAKLRTYLYHLARVDQELGRLVSMLRKSGRPTIVAFFGDHLPALPKVFDVQQMASGKSKDRQPTSWLLLDLRDRQPSAPTRDIASWQLGAVVLKQAGICDPYFAVAAEAEPALSELTSAAERNPKAGTSSVREAQEAFVQLALLQRSGGVCSAFHQAPPVAGIKAACADRNEGSAAAPSDISNSPAAVSVDSVQFGRYVEPETFAVGGTGTRFRTTDRLFAAVELQGSGGAVVVQVRLLDRSGRVVAAQVQTVQPRSWTKVNFDLRSAAQAATTAGAYTAETLLDGQVVDTTRITVE